MPAPASISSLVFSDGFDYYNSLYEKWTSGMPQGAGSQAGYSFISPGRFGYGQCLQVGPGDGNAASSIKALNGGPYSRLVVGFGCELAQSTYTGPAPFFGFIDSGGNVVCYLVFGTLGRIGFQTSAGTQYFANPTTFPYNSWFYIEVDVIFGSAGSFSLRINGQTVLTQTGIAVSTISSSYGVAMYSEGFGGPLVNYDDMYVLAPEEDTLGDSFLGDIKIIPLVPNGAGRVAQWTQTGGTTSEPWTAVNETPPDGDTSYIATETPGQIECFSLPEPTTVSPVGQVYGVSLYALGRKDDSPARVVSVGVGDGTTESFDAGSALSSGYLYVQRTLPVNPLTSEDWQLSDFADLQVAVKLIS